MTIGMLLYVFFSHSHTHLVRFSVLSFSLVCVCFALVSFILKIVGCCAIGIGKSRIFAENIVLLKSSFVLCSFRLLFFRHSFLLTLLLSLFHFLKWIVYCCRWMPFHAAFLRHSRWKYVAGYTCVWWVWMISKNVPAHTHQVYIRV